MRGSMVLAVAALLVSGCAMATSAANAAPGLSVKDGVLLRNGKPYRGVGANYFSLCGRVIEKADDETSIHNLDLLGKAGIPFVRTMFGGFWPKDQRLYVDDSDEFFRRLDKVVRAAEKAGVGLIPSLFWNLSTVPDLCREPMDAYGDPSSKTIQYIQQFTEDVVRRYRNSPAIWGWEFGNEYNLACDLPNASDQRPAVVPELGTAKFRSARDEVRWQHVAVAFRTFARAVRRYDRNRVIISGNAVPRPSAYHNVNGSTWDRDTGEQASAMLTRDNPDPMDTICIHLYPEPKNEYLGATSTIDDAMGFAMRVASAARKPLFIGEFGVDRNTGSLEQQRALFQQFLDAIEKNRVPLSAFWVFELPSQTECNVDFGNDRAFQIEMVSQANKRMAGSLR